MDRKLYTAGFVCAACLLCAVAQSCAKEERLHSERHHSFSDISKYVTRMDGPKRDAWQKPEKIIAMMKLKKGDHVADVGAGTGYFSRRIAKVVAPGGTVTAYDTEKNMVAYMRHDARKRGFTNYFAELVTVKDQVYPAGRFDVMFLCNVYHHVDDRISFVRNMGKGLKQGGRIILLDHRYNAPYGPPKHLRIPKKQAITEFNNAGFVLVKDEDFLPEQYYLEFRAK